jgi:hypothetical protein
MPNAPKPYRELWGIWMPDDGDWMLHAADSRVDGPEAYETENDAVLASTRYQKDFPGCYAARLTEPIIETAR